MGTHLQPSQLNSPGKDIESYLSSIHAIPILTKEQEQELALKLYEEDDLDAARQLVIHHLRFVVHIARSYQGYGLPLGDIIQEGNVGLMKAVDKYDPHRGVKLVSFAVHWIKAEIHEYILKNWRLVKIATTKAQRKLFFNLRSKKSSLSNLSSNEASLIARDLGVGVQDVIEMEKRINNTDLAIEDKDEENFSPSLYLKSNEPQPDEILEINEKKVLTNKLHDVIQNLDERSKDIIQSRWLSNNKLTLEDLSSKYGISRERVRQIENESLMKLKKSF